MLRLFQFSLLLFSTFHSPVLEAQGFRGARWGDSAIEISSSEQITLTAQVMADGSTVLSGKDNILGIPALVTYSLIDDKLVQGTTAFLDLSIGDDPMGAKEQISRIKDALYAKYGRPTSESPSPLGGAKFGWRSSASDIFLTTGSRGGEPVALVLYYSRALASLRKKLTDREIKKKF